MGWTFFISNSRYLKANRLSIGVALLDHLVAQSNKIFTLVLFNDWINYKKIKKLYTYIYGIYEIIIIIWILIGGWDKR